MLVIGVALTSFESKDKETTLPKKKAQTPQAKYWPQGEGDKCWHTRSHQCANNDTKIR